MAATPADINFVVRLHTLPRESVLASMNIDTDLGINVSANAQTLGSTYNPHVPSYIAYNAALARANLDWAAKINPNVLRSAVMNLSNAYRTNISLRGWTIGALCFLLCEGNPDNIMTRLYGLFMTGTVRTFESVPVYEDDLPPTFLGYGGYTSSSMRNGQFLARAVAQKTIIDVPLWKVRWFKIQENQHYDAPHQVPSFTTYLTEIGDLMGGSDISVYQSQADCFILRRFAPLIPGYISARVRVLRTGGLSQLLTKGFEATVSDVINVYCPSGESTCIFASFIWAYTRILCSGPYGMDIDQAITTAKSAISLYEDCWIRESVAKKLRSPNAKHIAANMTRSHPSFVTSKKKFAKMGVIGLSNNEFRKFCQFIYDKYNVVVQMVYLQHDRRVNGTFRFVIRMREYYDKLYANHARKDPTGERRPGLVTLLQCDPKGRLFRSNTLKPSTEVVDVDDSCSSPSCSGSLHAVACYPSLSMSFLSVLSVEHTKELIVSFEKVLTQHFKDVFTFATEGLYHSPELLDFAEITHLVEFQNKRYRQHRSKNTLIFSERSSETTSTAAIDSRRTVTKQQQKIYESSTAPLVCAYDIETVTYDPTTVSPDMVDPRFVFKLDDLYENSVPPDVAKEIATAFTEAEDGLVMDAPNIPLASVYGPANVQIPYSCQWIPVNTSDVGLYKKRKQDAMLQPVSYSKDILESELRLADNIPPFPSDMQLSDYILAPPKTVYGNKLLGACVDEMLLGMATLAYSQGRNAVFAFAHNGCGFDAFVVMQFTSFQFKKVLKTSRGILSATIVVPIQNGDTVSTVLIHLRDTKVHVPGSLKALCHGFDVPKKWRKIDFPIYLVKAVNCYDERIQPVVEKYGENDVLCLAFIIKKMNDLICESNWEPAMIASKKPPICQFLTVMSMIKKATANHFSYVAKIHNALLPKAVDITILRNLIKSAMMGGRVNAYMKTYASYFLKEVLSNIPATLEDSVLDEETMCSKRRAVYEQIVQQKSYMRTLDVTSLYPFVQSYCPMPTGALYAMSVDDCQQAIDSVYCFECEQLLTLCPNHMDVIRNPPRPFAVILVTDLRFCVLEQYLQYEQMGRTFYTYRNMCGRKTMKKGLVYSLEDRLEGEKPNQVYAYSNVDLYWMGRQGCSFTIVSGFGWKTSFVYNSFIVPAFQERIEAKRAGNKLLANSKKLGYNGTYGVTTQSDIGDSWFLISLPAYLRDDPCLNPKDERLMTFILAETDGKIVGPDDEIDDLIHIPNGQTVIKIKKIAECAESFSDLSPMQIGVAVTAWARHIMNLIMFTFDPVHMSYTDTDSITISAEAIDEMQRRNPALICETFDAPLGSLKNEHAEDNGTEPVIICSLIGTKKVKMHMTLNKEGDVRIFNTYKGLNPLNHTASSLVRMHSDFVDQKVALALLDIAFLGLPREVTVSNWKRKMGVGVEISSFEQKAESKSYFAFANGTHFVNHSHGVCEFFIPKGVSTLDERFNSNTRRHGEYYPFMYDMAQQSYVLCPERKSEDFFENKWGFKQELLYRLIETPFYFYKNANSRDLPFLDGDSEEKGLKETVELLLTWAE